ncbi:MAG: DUF4159 domain-containing protein, partial [Isosphaeraceae bacterium]|nr:DUF4159 domain-containing protein [Isosphaeraceae bacterium]
MVPIARRAISWSMAWAIGVVAIGSARAEVTRQDVERAIRDGVRYLRSQQLANGGWPGPNGASSLVTLALLTAGEPPDAPHMARALQFLSHFSPREINNTYAIALQTMAFAAADPLKYRRQIATNAEWLEAAQIHNRIAAGAWGYNASRSGGDNSNSQYALLGLNAASEAGFQVDPRVWALARHYWRACQGFDGGWGYRANMQRSSTASMTCAGISSLIIAGLRLVRDQEDLVGDQIQGCGRSEIDVSLTRAIDWLGTNFRVTENVGAGPQWKYYYLYGLERAGRLTGLRYFGGHDWYREGAEEIVRRQDPQTGAWSGEGTTPIVTTSFALLFLAKGRAPVVINKLVHGPGRDWNNDRDDVRNLVEFVARDWGHLLTWQTVDPDAASLEELLQAPILFVNGHEAPIFTGEAKKRLREFIEQGGFLFAEACCGRAAFDQGFRSLLKEVFPEPEYELHRLANDHAVWRVTHALDPDAFPLWGIEHGCRTVVIYSPQDLSCGWNLMASHARRSRVVKALQVGQNVVDYATGREMPADKLDVREVTKPILEQPKRGALHIAKLRHGGDWNIAPLAIPHLTASLREKLHFDVVINHREIAPGDPNLVHYPLIYLHGRQGFSFTAKEQAALRRHLEPGGGTLFVDAACGSPAFDTSFRKFVAELLPDHPLVPI